DLALWDELEITPRKPVRREFDDKLAPAYRFLSSRAGKKWNESYSLLRHLFDSVEHVGEDHRSPWVIRWGRFLVDEAGVLRKVTRRRRKSPSGASPCP